MDPFLLVLFLRTLDACYDSEALNRALDLLVARDFRVIADAEEAEYENVSPEVTPALKRAIAEYLTQRKGELALSAYHLGDTTLELQLALVPQEGLVECHVDTEELSFEFGRQPDLYPLLLDVCKDLYLAWRPVYGHIYYHTGMNPDRDEVLRLQIEYLYLVNLFSPELVQKLGRERLLSAPAWKVEELEDGAVFLAPTDYVAHPGYTLKKVAEHVGLQTPQLPGEEWDEWR